MTSSTSPLGKRLAEWQVMVYCPGKRDIAEFPELANRIEHTHKTPEGEQMETYDVIPWHSAERPTRAQFRSWKTRCPDCGLRWWKYMDPIATFEEEAG